MPSSDRSVPASEYPSGEWPAEAKFSFKREDDRPLTDIHGLIAGDIDLRFAAAHFQDGRDLVQTDSHAPPVAAAPRTSLLTQVPRMPWVLRDGQTVTACDLVFGLFDLAQPGYETLRDLTVNQVLDVLRQRATGSK